jgi:hypothetical protein
MIRGPNSGKGKKFSFLLNILTASGAHITSCLMGNDVFFPGVKQPEPEFDN